MPLRTLADCDDVFERNLVNEITGQGWSVVHAVRPPGPSTIPNVAYTVGLWSGWQHPECLVFGLSPERGQALLSLICREIKSGQKFTVQSDYPGLIEGLNCRFHSVSQCHHREYLGYCRWFYRGDSFTAAQLLWPDTQGIFPDQTGFDPALSGHQLILT